MNEILSEAQALLGPPVKIERHRDWAIWWCPFHDDVARRGERGRPNFGVQLAEGYWKCLRCGASGPSLATLRYKLGKWQPSPAMEPVTIQKGHPQVARLNEALAEARAALFNSPALAYLTKRGVKRSTCLTYGLGYGVTLPDVHLETVQAARKSRLLAGDGGWLWSGGIVYADPPLSPHTIQVRHLRQGSAKKYQTWGRLVQPLGAWRLTPKTRTVIAVEGLIDLLILAQTLLERNLGAIVPLYTGGSAASRPMLDWFSTSPYEYLLIPDSDTAGEDWTQALTAAIRRGEGEFRVARTPDGLDPDEAILSGWWPPGI